MFPDLMRQPPVLLLSRICACIICYFQCVSYKNWLLSRFYFRLFVSRFIAYGLLVNHQMPSNIIVISVLLRNRRQANKRNMANALPPCEGENFWEVGGGREGEKWSAHLTYRTKFWDTNTFNSSDLWGLVRLILFGPDNSAAGAWLYHR